MSAFREPQSLGFRGRVRQCSPLFQTVPRRSTLAQAQSNWQRQGTAPTDRTSLPQSSAKLSCVDQGSWGGLLGRVVFLPESHEGIALGAPAAVLRIANARPKNLRPCSHAIHRQLDESATVALPVKRRASHMRIRTNFLRLWDEHELGDTEQAATSGRRWVIFVRGSNSLQFPCLAFGVIGYFYSLALRAR